MTTDKFIEKFKDNINVVIPNGMVVQEGTHIKKVIFDVIESILQDNK